MSKNVEVLSHEALECLIGIIKQMVTLPKEVIDNLNLSDITTFSSAKIDALLTQTLTDANTHAEELCNTLTKLTCEKTTIQPTLENSKINIIYLYSADGTAPFQQYLKINTTELIDMGSTDIGLDEYLTITEAVKTYCTITDYETLKNEVVAVKNTIGTETLATTATTLKGAINELESKHYLEVFDLQGASVLDYAKTFNALTHNYFYANNCADLPDNMNYGYCSVDVSQDPLYRDITFYCPTTGRIYVNTIGADPDDATVYGTWSGWHEFLMKKDIVTTLDDTVTDNQIPSAKAVYDNAIKDKNIKTYTSIAQLGLTEGSETLSDIATNMSNNSMAILNVQSSCNVSEYPVGYGVLTVNKLNINRVSFIFTETGGASTLRQWFASYNGGKLNGWKRVCATSVADVAKTDFTISSSNYTISDSICEYCVVNGVCYVRMYIYCKSPSSTGDRHSVPIPKSKRRIEYFHGKVWNIENETHINAILTTDGYISITGGKAGCYYMVTESYPVSES